MCVSQTVTIVTAFNTELNTRTILRVFKDDEVAKQYVKRVQEEDEGIGQWSSFRLEHWTISENILENFPAI